LVAYFSRQGDGQGSGVTLTLHLQVVDVTVDREVVATLTNPKGAWPQSRFGFTWGPKTGGAYPVFEGHLDVEDEGPALCRLVLTGSYKPPYGIAGKAFDAALGKRIAVATVRGLLDTLRGELEAAYHIEFEREKHAARASSGDAEKSARPAIDPERIHDAYYSMPATELDEA
jgi:hypothetical protein